METDSGHGKHPTTDEKRSLISRHERRRRLADLVGHGIVLLCSLGLITFISYDTFSNVALLTDRTYMWFQFVVCLVFMADFFLSLGMSDNKNHYFLTHIFFLLISIPYLNIIDILNLRMNFEEMYYLSFIPLVRGAYSLAMVVGYVSSNRAVSIVASYAIILLSIIYFASLIFYKEEIDINSDVNDYSDALWWACMNVTTLGCYINPLSHAGKICAVILATSGMMMLPLFTVMVTDMVKKYNRGQQIRQTKIKELIVEKKARVSDREPPRKARTTGDGQSGPPQ